MIRDPDHSKRQWTDTIQPMATGLHQCQDWATNSQLRKHHFPIGKLLSSLFFLNKERSRWQRQATVEIREHRCCLCSFSVDGPEDKMILLSKSNVTLHTFLRLLGHFWIDLRVKKLIAHGSVPVYLRIKHRRYCVAAKGEWMQRCLLCARVDQQSYLCFIALICMLNKFSNICHYFM